MKRITWHPFFLRHHISFARSFDTQCTECCIRLKYSTILSTAHRHFLVYFLSLLRSSVHIHIFPIGSYFLLLFFFCFVFCCQCSTMNVPIDLIYFVLECNMNSEIDAPMILFGFFLHSISLVLPFDILCTLAIVNDFFFFHFLDVDVTIETICIR